MITFKFYRRQADSAKALREVSQTPLSALASRVLQVLLLIGVAVLGLFSVGVVFVFAVIVGLALVFRGWWDKRSHDEAPMPRNVQQHLADER